MSKKVLIHSLIFSPDGVSTAYLYNDIALRFQKEGYEVVVLSTTPHFNVVEEQLAKQPLEWKIPGIYKESNFYDTCATEEVQEHSITHYWVCLLAYYLFYTGFVYSRCKCNRVTFATSQYRYA